MRPFSLSGLPDHQQLGNPEEVKLGRSHRKSLVAETFPQGAREVCALQTHHAEPLWYNLGNKGGFVMKGFVKDIEGLAVKNDEFRQVLYTTKNCQLVVMALKPKEEIGAEVHKPDQFFRVEKGAGEAVLDGVRTAIRAGLAVVVPAGTNHNIITLASGLAIPTDCFGLVFFNAIPYPVEKG